MQKCKIYIVHKEEKFKKMIDEEKIWEKVEKEKR